MKLWFTKKAPKDVYDGKAPYDATVEQALLVAREVSAAPAEAERDVFDFVKVLHPQAEPNPVPEPVTRDPLSPTKPTVSRATREEMERRLASYRAFQMKLNEEREARIRRTMDDVRAQLKQSQNSSLQ
jgi:hypothetical protein